MFKNDKTIKEVNIKGEKPKNIINKILFFGTGKLLMVIVLCICQTSKTFIYLP